MTIAVDLGRKATRQTNKQTHVTNRETHNIDSHVKIKAKQPDLFFSKLFAKLESYYTTKKTKNKTPHTMGATTNN